MDPGSMDESGVSSSSSMNIFRPQVPPGIIYVNDKWTDSHLLTLLQRRVQTIPVDKMDFVDFFPTTDFAVIFVTEADLIAGPSFKRNIAKLKMAKFEKSVVIVERTTISAQYFANLQKFVVIELGLGIIPVTGFDECTTALVSIARMGSEDKTLPFMFKSRVPPLETYLMKVLLTVPSLGETKAQALLLKFKSLISICDASEEDLSKVIGPSSGKQVYNFFQTC